MYATSEQISDKGFIHQSLAIDHSTPPNFNKADTTPINAPPAMNPLAIRVPFSPRSLFTFSSLDRDVTYQFMAPPTQRKGKGRNMAAVEYDCYRSTSGI